MTVYKETMRLFTNALNVLIALQSAAGVLMLLWPIAAILVSGIASLMGTFYPLNAVFSLVFSLNPITSIAGYADNTMIFKITAWVFASSVVCITASAGKKILKHIEGEIQ